jgi:hypothetical protein
MSFLGFGQSTPQVQPLPVNNDAALAKKRQEAEMMALAESKAAGRRSTIAAGASDALMARSSRLG